MSVSESSMHSSVKKRPKKKPRNVSNLSKRKASSLAIKAQKVIKTEESLAVISSKFIDEPDPSLKTERDLLELSRLRAQLEIVGVKLEFYSKQIDLRQV